MHIGVLVIEMLIYSSNSLKEKRFVLRSVKDRLKNKFNVSVAEIGYQEKWQRSQLGIAIISNQHSHVENSLQQVFQFLDRIDTFEIVSYEFNYM
jgi:uncharacterized protein YlxP (DUF503 family)